MRPFSPFLRVRRDRHRPEKLIVESDVPLRGHALALALGAALVVASHGAGSLMSATLGRWALVLPAGMLAIVLLAWLGLPSMVLRTSLGRDLVETRRAR